MAYKPLQEVNAAVNIVFVDMTAGASFQQYGSYSKNLTASKHLGRLKKHVMAEVTLCLMRVVKLPRARETELYIIVSYHSSVQ